MFNKHVSKLCPVVAAAIISLASVSLANAEQKPVNNDSLTAKYALTDSQAQMTDATTTATTTYSEDMKAKDGSCACAEEMKAKGNNCMADMNTNKDNTAPNATTSNGNQAAPSKDAAASTANNNNAAASSTDKTSSANW